MASRLVKVVGSAAKGVMSESAGVAQRPSTIVTSSRDAIKYLGLIGITLVAFFDVILAIEGLAQYWGQQQFTTYVLILITKSLVTVFGVLTIFRERISFKVSVEGFTVFALIEMGVWAFITPNIVGSIGGGIGFAGILLLLLAIRPNFGPEANKRIYQAVAGIMTFIVSIFVIILGAYVTIGIQEPYTFGLDIRAYMGNGTFPGDVYYTYFFHMPGGITTFNAIQSAGIVILVGGIVCMGAAIVRNKIGLLLSGIVILAGTIVIWVGCGQFLIEWTVMNALLQTWYPAEWTTQLAMSDPGVYSIGLVLSVLEVVAMFIMIYASMAAKPIEKWRSTRDKCIAAAEVATRDGSLQTAVKYLEQAAMWSSKIDEEDKSIELLTRVKQIKDKAIKMRKQEAAEKAKKQYDKQQKAEVKQKAAPEPKTPEPKAPKAKVTKAKATKGKPAPSSEEETPAEPAPESEDDSGAHRIE